MDDDTFEVELAPMHEDGTRLSRTERLCKNRVKKVTDYCSQIKSLLKEVREVVGPFDEGLLIARKRRTYIQKFLALGGSALKFDDLPPCPESCTKCARVLNPDRALPLPYQQGVRWNCSACVLHTFEPDKKELQKLRGEVDSEIYLLSKELRDRGDPKESLDLVQTLLTIIDVLKKSARSSDEPEKVADEPEIAAVYGLNGPERREWELLCAAPYPQGDEGCSDMKVGKMQQLARLVKDVHRLHRRFFSANDSTSLEESVQSRNKHIRERYTVIKVDYRAEDITLEEAKDLWEAQGGRCSQCGELLWWSRLKGGALCFPELDRSDIAKGSYARNSSWTCHFCNTKKGMTDDLKSYDRILLETLREARKLLKSADNVDEVHDLLQAEVVRQASRQGFYKWAKQQKGGARRSTS